MSRLYKRLFITALAVMLFGFGCKKPSSRYGAVPIAGQKPSTIPLLVQPVEPEPTSGTPSSPALQEPARPVPAEITYLREVLQNLAKVNSFRANITIPSPQGQTTGDVEFSKQQGLHGVLQLPTNIKTEIYLVDQDKIFFRSGTSTWINLTGTPGGQQVSNLFQSAFSVNGELTDGQIKDTARLVSTARDPEGCILYAVDQSIVVAPQILQICVKDNLPIRLSSQTDDGWVVIRYRDFNQPITITAPNAK